MWYYEEVEVWILYLCITFLAGVSSSNRSEGICSVVSLIVLFSAVFGKLLEDGGVGRSSCLPEAGCCTSIREELILKDISSSYWLFCIALTLKSTTFLVCWVTKNLGMVCISISPASDSTSIVMSVSVSAALPKATNVVLSVWSFTTSDSLNLHKELYKG